MTEEQIQHLIDETGSRDAESFAEWCARFAALVIADEAEQWLDIIETMINEAMRDKDFDRAQVISRVYDQLHERVTGRD